ncbi:histidine phosphatase family protein [Candidatus Saccharibacteria bacterium]|nr:histidine phosphatase family protein [Candidatus Saccharibacteria bacterium]
MKLYFVRHGLSEMNKQQLFAGSTDTPLAQEGKEQAKQAGKQARDLAIDLIVSSPLSRAHQTAKIIAKEINYPVKNIKINPLLTERHFGELEGKLWAPDMDLDGIVDIELVDTVLNRAKLAYEWLKNQDSNNILVVSHGSFGRALRSILVENQPYYNRSHGGININGITNAQIYQWL